MLTQEQKDLLELEKVKLMDIVRPAVAHFNHATGLMPSITISSIENETKCGVMKQILLEISISVNL